MKQLYLIRHCETKEIAGEETAHARNDSPLSRAGQEQAERLRLYLSDKPVDLFLTSLFLRSQQTAAILNDGRKIPVFSAMALNEYFLRDDFQGVETIDQGLARSVGFLNQFRPFYESIAIVGHNSILKTILMSLLNMPFELGQETFDLPGTCRTLRYDWHKGDQNWRETDLFIP